MKKKVFLKAVSVLAAAAQILSCSAFAAVITGSGGTDSMSYWYDDFDDGNTTVKPASGILVSEENGGVKINNTSTTATKYGYIDIGQFDFSKPIVISYDVTPGNTIVEYVQLFDGSGKGVANLIRFENGYVYALNESAAKVATTTSCPTGTKLKVQCSLSYNNETSEITVKPYINGKQLINKTTNQPFEYTKVITADMSSNMKLRFYFVKGGGNAVIDNVMVRQEGEVNLPGGSWISDGKVGVTYTDSAKYLDSDGAEVKLSYTAAINNIPANNSATDAANYYTLKKYNIEDDPFLFNGTDAESKVVWSGAGGITISGFSQESSNEIFVMKLKDASKIKNFAGQPTKNIYTVLHSYGGTMTEVRESEILDADGTAISLEDGKLPVNTAKINFTLAYNSALAADKIKFKGNGVDITAIKDNGVYSLNLSDKTLEEATEYTITVGEIVKTFTTTGEKSYMSAAIERFTDESAVNNMYRSEKTNLTLVYDSDGERMQYTNMSDSTASTTYASYVFPDAFDFTKGDMLVSFDVELNQEIKYITPPEPGKYPSYLFNPQLYLGETLIGYMPVLEQYGIRCRTESGGRSVVPKELATMSKGDKCTIGILCSYDEETQTMKWTQLINGKPIADKDGNIIPSYQLSGISSVKIEEAPLIRFYSRYLQEGGVYIDNISVTTIDGITADSFPKMAGSTATIDIKSTVQFPEGTDPELAAPYYVNSLTKDDIKVTKYTDTLLACGTAVTGFGFDADTMTVSGLESGGIYGIEIIDTSKLSSISGSTIDKKYFKVGGDNGLLKTTILDINGETMTADSNGLWPANAAKISFIFPEGYVTDGVSVGNMQAELTDGAYTVDLSAQPLSADTEYQVTVNGSVYGTFTTGSGAFTVAVPVINADNTSTISVSNTEAQAKTMYIISASFDSDDNLVNLIYTAKTVQPGASESYSIGAPDITGASTLKVFVWNGFKTLVPYCAPAEKTLN